MRFGPPSGAREEPYLLWFGGFMCVVLVVVVVALTASSLGWLSGGTGPPALAAQSTELSVVLANRTNCADIGESDLRSPSEGLWFQINCASTSQPPPIASATKCNRTTLDPSVFTPVAPGLYVTRQTQGSLAYLWYSTSDHCFDLVSARAVTAVCIDQAVSFNWSSSPCSAHGGVLAWVNGR